jgi:hypothetical protein
VYFIFKSTEQGPSFCCTVPKHPTRDPCHRIRAPQRSRFARYYFYIRDEALGSIATRVASFFPFQTTYYLNGHSFICCNWLAWSVPPPKLLWSMLVRDRRPFEYVVLVWEA